MGVRSDDMAAAQSAGDGVAMTPQEAISVLARGDKPTEEERREIANLILRMESLLMNHWQLMWAYADKTVVEAFAHEQKKNP